MCSSDEQILERDEKMNTNEKEVSKKLAYKKEADEVACARCSKFVHVDEAIQYGTNWWLCPQCNIKSEEINWSLD